MTANSSTAKKVELDVKELVSYMTYASLMALLSSSLAIKITGMNPKPTEVGYCKLPPITYLTIGYPVVTKQLAPCLLAY